MLFVRSRIARSEPGALARVEAQRSLREAPVGESAEVRRDVEEENDAMVRAAIWVERDGATCLGITHRGSGGGQERTGPAGP